MAYLESDTYSFRVHNHITMSGLRHKSLAGFYDILLRDVS